jgi:hypothetical protein
VFAPGALYDDNGHSITDFSHTITDFTEGLDKIDLRQFSDVASINDLSFAPQSGGILVSWTQEVSQPEGDPIVEHEAILLKNVTANLKTSDFMFHVT